MNARSRALTDLAHDMPCMFTDLPHVCGWPRVGCVPCHANWQVLGRGFSFKAPDNFFAAGCPEAHDLVDGRKPGLSGDDCWWAWLRAHVRTMKWIFERGLVVVAR
jgi:hypothetical protein